MELSQMQNIGIYMLVIYVLFENEHKHKIVNVLKINILKEGDTNDT